MDNHDFDYRILTQRAHRPWPMPDRSWIMTQTWHDLLFAHWRIDRQHLRSLVPAALELDLYDGEAWIAVVPFRMTNVAPRGVASLPWLSAFPELNVRSYVTVDGTPGVYFFSLDASSRLAVAGARALFHLPYYKAKMRLDRDSEGLVRYRSRRTRPAGSAAELEATYRPIGPVFHPKEGSLEYFLVERYCLYTIGRDARPRRLDIHHPPWRLQEAEARFDVNTMADAAGIRLPESAPLLHFAQRQDVVAWPMTASLSAR
jgi:uncharacterized protein YqjF (DUF2071 family)